MRPSSWKLARKEPYFQEVESMGTRLLATSSRALAVLLAGAGIGCLVQLGTVRLIGAESFGIFAYAIAWTTVLGYIATLGFHVSLLRLLPAYQVGEDWARAKAVLRFATGVTVIAGVVLALAAAGAALVVHGPEGELGRTLLIGAAVVPLLALRLVGSAAVRAFGGVIASMLPERILRDSLAFGFLGLAVTTGLMVADAFTAMLGMLGAALITLWYLKRVLAARRPAELASALHVYSPRDWLLPAVPLTAIMLADTLMSRAGPLVIGTRGETIEAGIFAVAFGLAQLAALPRMSVSSLFAPTVSALYHKGDTSGLHQIIGRSAMLSLFGTVAVAVPLILGAPILLPWFGPEFVRAEPILLVLVIGQLAAGAAGPQQHLLTMTGHERQGAALMVAAAAGNVIGATVLYASFGMMGVAVASSLSVVAWNIGMIWFLNRRLKLRPGLAYAPGLLREAFARAFPGTGSSGDKPQEQQP